MATLKKIGEQQYVALARHDNNYYQGSLKELLQQFEDDEDDIDNYRFYALGEPVHMEMKKELVIQAELVVTR